MFDFLKTLFGKKQEAEEEYQAEIEEVKETEEVTETEEVRGTGGKVYDLKETEKDRPEAEEVYFNPLIGIEPPKDTAYMKGGSIRLTDVSASSPNRAGRLEHVSFEVKAGECAAFIGDADSGIGLIPDLVLHSFEAQEGTVEVDGINVRDYRISALKERILLLPPVGDREASDDLTGTEILILDAEKCAPSQGFAAFLEKLRQGFPELTVLILAADEAYAAAAGKKAFFKNGTTDGFV